MSKPFNPDWYYFGCWDGLGHNVYRRHGELIREPLLEGFDGRLCPLDTDQQFLACFSRLGNLGLSALAFWDRTGDRRPGSNSIIFAPSLICDPRTMVDGAHVFFPVPYARWTTLKMRRWLSGPYESDPVILKEPGLTSPPPIEDNHHQGIIIR